MKVSIKTGLQPQAINELKTTHARNCEVWFDINKSDQYADLFKFLKSNRIETGLHFWGAMPDNTWINLAYPDHDLIRQSFNLIKTTLEIAAKNEFKYVNIHPGCRAKVKIDFIHEKFDLLSEPINLEQSEDLFFENVNKLNQYASNLGIILTIESVPARVTTGWYDQAARTSTVTDIFELPITTIIKAANCGLYVANDFGHTAAQTISDNFNSVQENIFKWSKILLPQTKLIHAGFIVKPFNGTDFHDTFENKFFKNGQSIPNSETIVELLNIYKNRPDIWILVEPKTDHITNFLFLKQLLLENNLLTDTP